MLDKYKKFFLETDASDVATGAVLQQLDTNGELRPCGFLSKALHDAEIRWQIYNKELYAIIRALEEWQHFLMGTPNEVIISCDHKNLTYYKEPQKLTQQQF